MNRLSFLSLVLLVFIAFNLIYVAIAFADVNFGIGVGDKTIFGGTKEKDGKYEKMYLFDVDFLLKEKILDFKYIWIDWRADIGVIMQDKVHPKVFTTLIGNVPITNNVKFILGGGFGHIVNSGDIDGLDSNFLAGTIRMGFKFYERVSLIVDHYSIPWRNDQGRNPYKLCVSFDF